MTRGELLRRAVDVALVLAMMYMALLVLGVIRRGGVFEPGTAVPDFSVRSVEDGRVLRLADFRGKVLVLDFFSTGCSSCRAGLSSVEGLVETGAGRVAALLVSLDEPSTLAAFLKARGSPVTAAVDDGTASRAYLVDTIPHIFVIDPEGRVQKDFIGDVRWADVEPWLPAATPGATQ